MALALLRKKSPTDSVILCGVFVDSDAIPELGLPARTAAEKLTDWKLKFIERYVEFGEPTVEWISIRAPII